MSEGYQKAQRDMTARQCRECDVVITTALIPGRPAPRLITAEMVARMKPGSVIVDMAAANGGNVEGTVKDQAIVTDNGVTIIKLSPEEIMAFRKATKGAFDKHVKLVGEDVVQAAIEDMKAAGLTFEELKD